MKVIDINIGDKLLKFKGFQYVNRDSFNPNNYVLIGKYLSINDSDPIIYKVHENLWKFISQNMNSDKREFTTGLYYGISRINGEPIVKYEHCVCLISINSNDKAYLNYLPNNIEAIPAKPLIKSNFIQGAFNENTTGLIQEKILLLL